MYSSDLHSTQVKHLTTSVARSSLVSRILLCSCHCCYHGCSFHAHVLPAQPSSIQFSCSVVSDSLWHHGLQHARRPCPSATPRVDSNSCPLSQWCPPTISSSVVPFSSCLQSFLASGSFQMSQFFTSGGQSFGASAQEWLTKKTVDTNWPDRLYHLFVECLIHSGGSLVAVNTVQRSLCSVPILIGYPWALMLVPNHLYLSPKFLTHQLRHLLLSSIHGFVFFFFSGFGPVLFSHKVDNWIA